MLGPSLRMKKEMGVPPPPPLGYSHTCTACEQMMNCRECMNVQTLLWLHVSLSHTGMRLLAFNQTAWL